MTNPAVIRGFRAIRLAELQHLVERVPMGERLPAASAERARELIADLAKTFIETEGTAP